LISGIELTVIGEENVPKDKAVLYVGNHTSFFDVVLTYVRVPRPTGYISKKEFEKIPLLSTWMKFLYCQFLDRKDLKSGIRMILKCIDLIKHGVSICVFPEGTRNRNPDTMLPFHNGSFKIAKKANCPIVPMALTNSSALFEQHYPRIKKAHVILEYGTPYYITDLNPEDQKHIGDYVHNQLQTMYNKNKELL
jgi:1-acyl-sn-glycerol-3-phosphate acyltransferase